MASYQQLANDIKQGMNKVEAILIQKTSCGNTSFQGSQKDPQVMCQICGKQNHTALKCWNRFDHSFQPEDELP